MNATVIDTLRFADRLKQAGFEAPRAEGLARALGEELDGRVMTRNDREAFGVRLDGLEAKVEARFESVDARFDSVYAKFDSLEAKFDAGIDGLEARFDARIDGLEAKVDAQYESLNMNIDSLTGKFKLLVGMVAFGFTLMVGLGTYNAVAPRIAEASQHQAPQAPPSSATVKG